MFSNSNSNPSKAMQQLSIQHQIHQMDWTRGPIIGQGSTATVSLAISCEVFAVKSAELSQSESLQKEQKIMSSISPSPYIVNYKGCDITRDNNNKFMYNIFLEYMPGGTLTDAIRSNGGRMGEPEIRNYTWQVLKGLDHLHSNGLAHCDIKGRNILISPNGAKIADFGCSKRVDPGEGNPGPVSGTPMYMAPEVARGEEQGFAGDVWGLGCTVIEMATGGAPWSDLMDPVSVIYRVGYSGQVPEIPCFLSVEARDFLDKCLRRDPMERWTASQLLKHPFLVGYNSKDNPFEVSNLVTSSPSSSSPTSILDQVFWNSIDEGKCPISNMVNTSEGIESAEDRIRRLSLISVGPSWDHDDENWVTIRSGECVGVSEELVGSNFRSGDINGDFLGLCKYGKDSFVASSDYATFERDRDTSLIPRRSLLFSLA